MFTIAKKRGTERKIPSGAKELLAESRWVALGDYIIAIAWSPDASKLAAATVEGSVFLIGDHGDSVFDLPKE